jgi:hypothetical protein
MTFSREGFDHGQFFAASGSGSVSQHVALVQGPLPIELLWSRRAFFLSYTLKAIVSLGRFGPLADY